MKQETETLDRKPKRKVGVLLTREGGKGHEGSNGTTAEIVWGLRAHHGLKTTAGSPKEVIRELQRKIRDDLYEYTFILFDDAEEARQELNRRTEAMSQKLSPFSLETRAKLQDLFSADPTDDTGRDEDLLGTFDRIVYALTDVECGTFDPLYLVSAFNRHETGACVYAPRHDPRYKRELERGSEDIPTKLPGQDHDDRHDLAAQAYAAISAERKPKIFAAALRLSLQKSPRNGQDNPKTAGAEGLFEAARLQPGPSERVVRALAGRIRLDLMGEDRLDIQIANSLLSYIHTALDTNAQTITLDEIQAVEGLADFTQAPNPGTDSPDPTSRRLDNLSRVRGVLEEALGLSPTDH